jgi:hypothetical protein
MRKPSKQVQEIQQRVQSLSPQKDAKYSARYIGSVAHEDREPDEQSRLKFLGFSMPQVRALAKAEYSFSHLSDKEQLPIWLELYHHSEVHEELSLALIWISHPRRIPLVLQDQSQLFRLQSRVDNWAISDSVSELIAALSEVNPKTHRAQLQQWNSSKNPWDRRQSLVGIYCYAIRRRNPMAANQALALVKNLIADPHYFVQKAVGWSLREIHRVDPKAQQKFLEKNLARLTGIAFSTATERYPAAAKEALKIRRQKKRKSKPK